MKDLLIWVEGGARQTMAFVIWSVAMGLHHLSVVVFRTALWLDTDGVVEIETGPCGCACKVCVSTCRGEPDDE